MSVSSFPSSAVSPSRVRSFSSCSSSSDGGVEFAPSPPPPTGSSSSSSSSTGCKAWKCLIAVLGKDGGESDEDDEDDDDEDDDWDDDEDDDGEVEPVDIPEEFQVKMEMAQCVANRMLSMAKKKNLIKPYILFKFFAELWSCVSH